MSGLVIVKSKQAFLFARWEQASKRLHIIHGLVSLCFPSQENLPLPPIPHILLEFLRCSYLELMSCVH